MAYATTNPPQKIFAGLGGGGIQMWVYSSTDVHTDVDADDYFSNGDELGMRVGDIVVVSKTDATIGATLHSVRAQVTAGAASISPAILA